MMTTTRANADTWMVFVGGLLVCVGTTLPWMSFFAGLHSLSGLVGLYGRILFASGALVVLFGTTMLLRRSPWISLAIGALGVAQTLFVVWLFIGLRTTLQALGMHAMLLARPGPGLFVALAGAMLVSAIMLLSALARVRVIAINPASRATGVRRF